MVLDLSTCDLEPTHVSKLPLQYKAEQTVFERVGLTIQQSTMIAVVRIHDIVLCPYKWVSGSRDERRSPSRSEMVCFMLFCFVFQVALLWKPGRAQALHSTPLHQVHCSFRNCLKVRGAFGDTVLQGISDHMTSCFLSMFFNQSTHSDLWPRTSTVGHLHSPNCCLLDFSLFNIIVSVDPGWAADGVKIPVDMQQLLEH